MRRNESLLRGTAALALALAATVARAGGIDVSPILVELTKERPSAIVTVRNASDAPLRLEARAFTWAQNALGEMSLSPTADVAVFPPLVELAPGAARNFRVGTAVAPGAEERSYRIFLEQLPAPQEPGAPAQVSLLTRIGIPVFVSPPRPTSRAEIAALAVSAGRVSFVLRNAGNVRVRATGVTVAARDAHDGAIFKEELPAWYVLSGGERHYAVELDPGTCTRAKAVSVTVRHVTGDVEARIPLAHGACGP